MTEYRRNFVKGGSYFFTADQIDTLRKAFRDVKLLYPFDLDAMVVLPEHLHCIWMLATGDANYPDRWRRIKAAFSRGLPDCNFRSPSKILKGERGIVSGSAVIGNIHCGTRTTGGAIWITPITIR